MMVCFSGNIFAGDSANEKHSEYQLLQRLRSDDVFQRTDILQYIVKGLQNKSLTLTKSLKDECDKIIREAMNGKFSIDIKKDDEGLYGTAILDLASEINERQYLPLFLNTLPSRASIKALMKQGDFGIDAIMKYAVRPDISLDGKLDIIATFLRIAELQKEGCAISAMSRQRIKEYSVSMITKPIYIQPNDMQKYSVVEKQHIDTRVAIKKNILWLFAELGDKDLIPIVEKVSREDAYSKQIDKAGLKFMRMTKEERENYFKHASREEIKAASKRTGQMVTIYPIREEALKVLKQMKR